jgi:hypothetical protein
MVRNMGIARDLGYLTFPDGLVVKDLKALERLRPDQMAIIATGSQGEPMAALARMANRDHPVSITAGDTVLMASSLIPGNENAIYRVINELTRWGANVVHKGNAKVHVSGHASAGELAYCFNIIRPSNVLPVHGEWRHLRANADIAIRTGVESKRVLIAHDGSVIDLVDGRASITGTVPAGLVYVDAMTVGGATEETLHVRRTLAEEGVVTIVCIVDPDTGKLQEDPDYLAHGFPPEVMDFSAATPAIQAALTKAARDGLGSPHPPAQPADHPGHRRRLSPRGLGRSSRARRSMASTTACGWVRGTMCAARGTETSSARGFLVSWAHQRSDATWSCCPRTTEVGTRRCDRATSVRYRRIRVMPRSIDPQPVHRYCRASTRTSQGCSCRAVLSHWASMRGHDRARGSVTGPTSTRASTRGSRAATSTATGQPAE